MGQSHSTSSEADPRRTTSQRSKDKNAASSHSPLLCSCFPFSMLLRSSAGGHKMTEEDLLYTDSTNKLLDQWQHSDVLLLQRTFVEAAKSAIHRLKKSRGVKYSPSNRLLLDEEAFVGIFSSGGKSDDRLPTNIVRSAFRMFDHDGGMYLCMYVCMRALLCFSIPRNVDIFSSHPPHLSLNFIRRCRGL